MTEFEAFLKSQRELPTGRYTASLIRSIPNLSDYRRLENEYVDVFFASFFEQVFHYKDLIQPEESMNIEGLFTDSMRNIRSQLWGLHQRSYGRVLSDGTREPRRGETVYNRYNLHRHEILHPVFHSVQEYVAWLISPDSFDGKKESPLHKRDILHASFISAGLYAQENIDYSPLKKEYIVDEESGLWERSFLLRDCQNLAGDGGDDGWYLARQNTPEFNEQVRKFLKRTTARKRR